MTLCFALHTGTGSNRARTFLWPGTKSWELKHTPLIVAASDRGDGMFWF